MRTVSILLRIILLLASTSLSAAQVYKWVDKEGTVHYSDSPQRNATIVPIRDDEKIVVPVKSVIPDAKKISPAQKNQEYAITIEQPKDQETLQNTGGEVTINISSSLSLAQGDRWQILMDGKKIGEPQTQNSITLQNIERGEHTLQIQAIDTRDKVLASSVIITFYVHQTTVQQQNTKP
jgi:FlaG/FlaF family flagellin (archaellin)